VSSLLDVSFEGTQYLNRNIFGRYHIGLGYLITYAGEFVVFQTVMDLKNVKVYVGDAPAECTLTCEDSVMTALGSGKMTAKDALAQDKLDIDGQLDLVMLLSPYVSSL
jgi:SCP-2 sterol transfer family